MYTGVPLSTFPRVVYGVSGCFSGPVRQFSTTETVVEDHSETFLGWEETWSQIGDCTNPTREDLCLSRFTKTELFIIQKIENVKPDSGRPSFVVTRKVGNYKVKSDR